MLRTVAIANFFIDRGLQQGRPLYGSSLTALLFFAHGSTLGAGGQPLLDAKFVAAAEGPQILQLSRLLQPFGSGQVTKRLTVLSSAPGAARPSWTSPVVAADDAALPLLNRLWDSLGQESPYLLHDLVTQPYSPWAAVWHAKDRRPEEQREIDNERIGRWFVAKSGNGPSPLDAMLAAIRNKPLTRFMNDLG